MNKAWEVVKKYLKLYFIDALGAMALGLFSSLIIGLIISQLSLIPFLSFLSEFAVIVKSDYVVGAAIGVSCAWGLKSKPLVLFSSAATGAFGYSLGGPVGAYLASVFGSQIASIVAGKTKIDIILAPLLTIVAGCLAGKFVGPGVSAFMTGFGSLINSATELTPFPMGIAVSVLVGLALTAPISSAAICIMLGLNGLAAGAATAGCCAQMIGFAVTSYRDNKMGGFISQGIGTSMLQFSNIIRNPAIWIAPTLASAVLGPVSTLLFKMTNTPVGAGMGTSGLVGPIGVISSMSSSSTTFELIVIIALMCFILPAVLSLFFDFILRKIGWVKDGDMLLKFE